VNQALNAAYEMLDRCENQGVNVLWPTKSDFPVRLRTIPNPPLILFSLGDSTILNGDSVAVIGTREPTDFGVRSARKIARTLAEQGWVIVSGLAEGCDTAGHEGCLDGAGRTVAALAHGFGRIYPASNKGLAERIISHGGCLITEYPPGQPPTRGSFVERDRLQSGLSLGVIVIETDVKGGTMHTVRHAIEQSRPIAAVSHPEKMKSEPKAQGNRLLVAEGHATALEAKKDVFDFTDSLRRERPKTEIGVAELFPVDQQELKW
jgi:DNA processing protein